MNNGVNFFDTSSLNAASRGYSGVVDDGRHLYFVPLANGDFHGLVARHDPSRELDDPNAWSFFDSAAVHPASRGFVDGLFDGSHLYLVPFCNGRHHGQVTRYDTTRPFEDPASWQVFDTASVHEKSIGFVSGCWDGRHLYFAPYQLDHAATTHGRITRFDTRGDFADPAAWQVFDATAVHADCRGFHSAVWDGGDHVFFVPYLRGPKDYNSRLARYDRRLPFDAPQAWQSFDLTAVHPGCRGYVGGTMHAGRLHLAPYCDGTDRHGRVLRFDCGAALDDVSAWTMFDCARVDAGSRGFFGAVCDARSLYLVPHCRGPGQYHGQITRHALGGAFDDPRAWSFCDLGRLHADARGFIGGAAHGEHLYLAPFETDAGRHSGLVARLRRDAEHLWSHHA
jgi:hypothetical protein